MATTSALAVEQRLPRVNRAGRTLANEMPGPSDSLRSTTFEHSEEFRPESW